MIDSKIEQEIQKVHNAKDYQQAMVLVIENYGSALFGYLWTVLKNRDDVDEVFSLACEEIWTSLPGFEWRSAFLTWAYSITRRTCAKYLSAHAKCRFERLSQITNFEALMTKVKTSSITFFRNEKMAILEKLKTQLSLDDQTILFLRIDREMSFREIAITLSMSDEPQSPEDLDKSEISCRKRFERIKDKLYNFALASGYAQN